MAFGGLILTNKGRNLQVKAQTGVQLNFTRIAIGDGDLGGSSILDLNALKHEVKTIAITKLKALTGGKAVVGGSFNNTALATGFYWKEIGVFAQDPNEGEILYCYGNAGINAEYIPAGGGADIVEKSVDVIIIVGNAANVSATIDGSLVYYTQNDILAVDQTQAPTSPGNGKIQQLFNWLGNRIKAITGKDNWWDNPDTTLSEAKTHIDAEAPHTGHETPSGAQEKVNAHENTTDPHPQYALDTELAALQQQQETHKAEKATQTEYGHVQNGVYTTTLSATWTSTSAPFSKSQTVTGILATDTPIIDIVMSGTFATDEARLEAWGYIYRAVTSANTVTFYAMEKPTVELPLQIKVVR